MTVRNLLCPLRQPPQAPGNSPAEASELQRLREGTASLQAALSNTQAQRQGLEGELSALRGEVDALRNQVANAPNTLQLERRLQEVLPPPPLPPGFHLIPPISPLPIMTGLLEPPAWSEPSWSLRNQAADLLVLFGNWSAAECGNLTH